MKLKKKTSMMLAASAAVAAVGIAAVSFAAWIGGDSSVDATASTGTVVLEGISFNEDSAKSFTLVPYDQEADSIKSGDKIAYVALDVVAYENFTITATTDSTLGFMVKYDTVAPVGFDGKESAPETTDGYSAVNGGAAETFTIADLTKTAEDTYTVYAYIILNNGVNTDAGQTGITITFTLS